MDKNNKECVIVKGVACDGCNFCNTCDLDPDKICDNCMRCINNNSDYAAIAIDEIVNED